MIPRFQMIPDDSGHAKGPAPCMEFFPYKGQTRRIMLSGQVFKVGHGLASAFRRDSSTASGPVLPAASVSLLSSSAGLGRQGS
jgi:hypothetical protein